MITQNYYTGEPVITGSPSINDSTTNEAANMASFGAYNYDMQNRRQMITPIINPGGYGYNQQYYQPYQPGIGMGNPVLQPGYNPYNYYNAGYYYQQPQQPQMPTHMTIKSVSNNGEFLPPADLQDRIDQLERDYWNKTIDNEAKRSVETSSNIYNNPYGYNMNYYGYNTYGSGYFYNPVDQEIAKEIDKIKEEARENRRKLNIQISKLAHNIGGEPLSDEEIEDRYTDKVVEIPTYYVENLQEMRQMEELRNMTPFDNSSVYRQFYASVTAEHDQFISPNANMKEWSESMGLLWDKWEMEEEMHRRRDTSGNFNSDAYRSYIRLKAKERYINNHNERKIKDFENLSNVFTDYNSIAGRQKFINDFCPALSDCATIADDGTLTISAVLPSERGVVVQNENEAEYEKRRERFNAFVNSVPSSIYDTAVNDAKARAIERGVYG